MRRNAALIFAALAALGSPAFAAPGSEPAPNRPTNPNRPNNPPPDERALTAPTWNGEKVTVTEHLGAQIPLDARFRTADGAHVTLGEVMQGGLPAILTFNYSDCPMLCSQQLNGLSTALPKIADRSDGVMLRPGVQFRIVTIDLEPGEPLAKIQKMREKYIARLPANQRESAKAGWTFLVAENPGDGTQIHRVAASVGFSYMYVPERAEWAHPAALIFLASSGVVTRYVYGIEFPAPMMRESIIKAGTHEPASTVGFLNRCYHYDPDANSHAHAGMLALRIGAGGMILLLLSGFGLATFLKRRRSEVSES